MTNVKTAMVLGSALALLATAGCKKQNQAAPASKAAPAAAGAPSATTAPVVDPAIATINAAIPASWKGKIEFAAREIKDDFHNTSLTAIVPKDWPKGFLGDEIDAPKSSDFQFGFDTKVRIGESCAGTCKPHTSGEFAELADKEFFADLLSRKPPLNVEIVKDEKSADQRVLIAHQPKGAGGLEVTYVQIVWWKDGAERVSYCMVDLDEKAGELASAFEKACLATKK